jgi:hypothetical protein
MGRRQRRLRIPAESDEDKGMGIRPPTEGYARISGGNAPWLRDTLGGLSIAPLNLGARDRAPNARARLTLGRTPRMYLDDARLLDTRTGEVYGTLGRGLDPPGAPAGRLS